MSPIKEPFYFSQDIGNRWRYGWEGYAKLFEHARPDHRVIGEASTNYLFSKVAVPTIENELPGARYIVMVRNPVDMAYALHEQQLRSFYENIEDFGQAWQLASKRRVGELVPPGCKDPVLLDYRAWCRMGEQLERLFSIVPRDRVLVLVLDDVKQDPRREYVRVLDFLGVQDDSRMAFPVYNPAREWRSMWMARGLRALAKTIGWSKHVRGILPRRSLGIVQRLQAWNARERARPPLSPDLRAELEACFAEDVAKLERLLGRAFPHWRSAQRLER